MALRWHLYMGVLSGPGTRAHPAPRPAPLCSTTTSTSTSTSSTSSTSSTNTSTSTSTSSSIFYTTGPVRWCAALPQAPFFRQKWPSYDFEHFSSVEVFPAAAGAFWPEGPVRRPTYAQEYAKEAS